MIKCIIQLWEMCTNPSFTYMTDREGHTPRWCDDDNGEHKLLTQFVHRYVSDTSGYIIMVLRELFDTIESGALLVMIR